MGRWITNLYDPWAKDALSHVVRLEGETLQNAQKRLERTKQWALEKRIGEPQETPYCSVEDLKKMGMVGVYERD